MLGGAECLSATFCVLAIHIAAHSAQNAVIGNEMHASFHLAYRFLLK